MGAPCIPALWLCLSPPPHVPSCVFDLLFLHLHVTCRGGQLSFVGGWSGCSSSLLGFCGLWVVVLCIIVVICGRLGICLDGGQFMLFVGGHAHFVWWVVVVCGSLG